MPIIQISIEITDEQKAEILSALLLNNDYEGAYQENEFFYAFIDKDVFREEKLRQILSSVDKTLKYKIEIQENKNWNKEWETNYPAVKIKDCNIRADFHPIDKTAKYEILINPKMSFGTAHHETTALMIEALLEMDLKEKNVMDMGCGTGVLAILAAKKEAKTIDAVDNDNWAFENTKENVQLNKEIVNIYLDDVSFLKKEKQENYYDIFIANINRNILLRDIKEYVSFIKPGGELLLSGFYEKDLNRIKQEAENNSLDYLSNAIKKSWVVARFKKRI
jgi:ribosomal protein L11 methyltransferase